MESLVVILVALIASAPPSVMAYLAWKKGKVNQKAIQDIHISINSRMDELLSITKSSAFAAGRKSEVDKVGKTSLT